MLCPHNIVCEYAIGNAKLLLLAAYAYLETGLTIETAHHFIRFQLFISPLAWKQICKDVELEAATVMFA